MQATMHGDMAALESAGAAGTPRPRVPTPRHLFRLKVTICAWCERRAIHGVWDDFELQVMPLTERHLVTHGICPDCFEDRTPGRRYPAS
jgi:hypothetical protein